MCLRIFFVIVSFSYNLRAEEVAPPPRLLATPVVQKAIDPMLLKIIPGSMPIVVSAPHGGRLSIPNVPARRGEGAERFVAVRDDRTDELAEHFADTMQKRLGVRPYLIIAKFERKQLDVNRVPSSAYESEGAKEYYDAYYQAVNDAIVSVRKKYQHGLFLDIHGQATSKESIYRGTLNLKSVRFLQERYGLSAIQGPKSIMGLLSRKGYDVIPKIGTMDREERYTGGHLVANFGSHYVTGLDAMQIEFGTAFRAKDKVKQTAEDLADTIIDYAKEYLPKP